MSESSAHARPTSASPVTMFIDERTDDGPGVAIPCARVHLVVRIGPSATDGLDVHVMGARQRVVRKRLRGGLGTVTARLELAQTSAVLGVPASEVSGRVVSLADLWGTRAASRLRQRLSAAEDLVDASAIVAEALGHRLSRTVHDREPLVEHAAARLQSESVRTVAAELGVSERHLRRRFRHVVGLGPKTFARLGRFRRAMASALRPGPTGWAGVAIEAGYYDQAHLVAECRAIAGVTPRELLAELRTSHSFGWRHGAIPGRGAAPLGTSWRPSSAGHCS